MYADYPDSHDIAEFKRNLGDTLWAHPSFAHIIGFEARLTLMFIAGPHWFIVLLWLALWSGITMFFAVGFLNAVQEQNVPHKWLLPLADAVSCTVAFAVWLGN